MTNHLAWRRLRPLAAMAAVLLSAVASIATSDCATDHPIQFERHDNFTIGESLLRYRVFAPDADHISLSVNDWATLEWVDPPAALTVDAGGHDPGTTVSSNKIEFDCQPAAYGGDDCKEFVIEVTRTDATIVQELTLTVGSVISTCEAEMLELKVVPE